MTANIGIIGATGYTGSELTRLLTHHKHIDLTLITSRRFAGKNISDIHPFLKEICDMKLTDPLIDEILDLDLVFLALPHGISMNFVHDIGFDGPKIIDLSGDFRLSNKDTYETWYNKKHVLPDALDRAVYGLPELFRKDIANARFVANPGCYPTSVLLALAPVIRENMIDISTLVVDSKSGVTGAGAKSKKATHFPRANEDFRAYKVGRHQHTPEVEEILSKHAGKKITLLFTPHLLPLNRGILTTVYCKAQKEMDEDDLIEVYKRTYKDEPFIRLRNMPPNVQSVRGSNYCDIHLKMINRTKHIVLLSAIDNLVKGAAGQAIQNMNIMLGFDEKQGIQHIPLSP